MAFEISKTFTIKAAPASVWAFLTDPARVAKCLPGAAITDKLDDKTWAGTMTVKVGPVQSSYKGKVTFEKLDASARSAEIVATGMDVRGKGGADLRLSSSLIEKGPAETEVTTLSRVNVTGILAQMGRGMIQDVSDQMFQIFSTNMRNELEAAAPPPPQAGPAQQVAPEKPPPPEKPAALDVGSIGAKALARQPAFWIVVAVAAAVVVYLIAR
ncbi:MAG TPA: SRPBCC family protein [Myxococcales bacterium]|nr:SRPBCC family protein [Myxococcales bacterium]